MTAWMRRFRSFDRFRSEKARTAYDETVRRLFGKGEA